MKFSTSLKFNAVADWWDEYISYSALKKQIYQLEKKQVDLTRSRELDLESNERTALIDRDGTSHTDHVFQPLLDIELKKISDFYRAQEQKLLQEVTELESLVKLKDEESFIGADSRYMTVENEDDDEDDEDDERRRNSQSRERYDGRSSSGRRRRAKSESKVSFPSSLPMRPATSESSGHQRRYSVSSSEDNLDLEASLASLGQIPENDALQMSTSDIRGPSASPRRAKVSLSNIFNVVKPGSGSISSLHVPESIWTAKTNYAYDTRILFKKRITTLYNLLTSLKAYVELNYTGFRKILKKYDKITYSELQDHYMHDYVEEAYPFRQETKDRLRDGINRLIALYAKCITHDDRAAAVRQLKTHQREHIAWERDTVWRQMINQERHGRHDGQPKAIGGHVDSDESSLLAVPTPVGRFRLKPKYLSFALATLVFAVLLNVQSVSGVEANNCFAILVFSTVLWATEAIPLFVTSILVPLLLVVFRVFISEQDPHRLSTQDATKYVFSQMFSPTIMLLIGGFTISSALSKTNIDRVLITRILNLAGTKPSVVLLAFMGVSCFASMWISNVAAPTLCFALIKPILRTLPPKASFAPCLIIGIALAANIGGQSSPISSPQNLIALQHMEPPLDWAQWFAVALPVSAISIILIWLLLLASYRPTTTIDGEPLVIREIRPTREKFTLKQYWVIFVCIVTIGLWLVEKEIEDYVGDMGVIAIIPIVAFFSTGVLRKDDFEQFLWTIVFLAMGGIALGKGVTSSGLLEVMDENIRDSVKGLSFYTVVLVLSLIVLVISTFISHTIASVLLVPIAKEVASNFDGGKHQRLLIFLTGLLCSTGMGMPVSGFPNQTAATQEDDMGQLYLSNIDFLKNGVPASAIAALVVATVGYLLMLAIGL